MATATASAPATTTETVTGRPNVDYTVNSVFLQRSNCLQCSLTKKKSVSFFFLRRFFSIWCFFLVFSSSLAAVVDAAMKLLCVMDVRTHARIHTWSNIGIQRDWPSKLCAQSITPNGMASSSMAGRIESNRRAIFSSNAIGRPNNKSIRNQNGLIDNKNAQVRTLLKVIHTTIVVLGHAKLAGQFNIECNGNAMASKLYAPSHSNSANFHFVETLDFHRNSIKCQFENGVGPKCTAPQSTNKEKIYRFRLGSWLADIDDSDPMVAMTTPTTISSFIEHIFAYN